MKETIKPELKEMFDKYDISRRVVKLGKIKLYQYYYTHDKILDENGNDEILVEIGTILFRHDKEGLLIPYVYDYKDGVDGGKPTGKVIKKNTIIYDWIRYVKYNMRRKNVTTMKYENGNLWELQWEVTIKMINSICNREGKVHTATASRQTGKSVIFSTKLGAFMSVFMAKYVKMKNNTMDSVIGSYKVESIGKLFDGIRAEIGDAIEFFNMIYPKTPLVYGNDYKKSKTQTARTNSFTFEVGIKIGGEILPWARTWAISISAGMRSDGLSCELLLVDEISLVKYRDMQPVEGFLQSTNGSTILTGISSSDEDSVATNYQRLLESGDEGVVSYRIPFPVHYHMLKHERPERAVDNYKAFESKMISWGGMNTEKFLCHFMVSFNASSGGKFLTRSHLKSLDVQILPYNTKYLTSPKKNIVRRVAGLDVSSISDYCVITTLDCYGEGMNHDDDLCDIGLEDAEVEFSFKYRDSIVFNEDRNRLDFKVVARNVAKYCEKASIDILMIDATSAEVSASLVQDELIELGVTTLVLPCKFNAMKVSMMYYFENVFFSGSLQLLKDKDRLFGSKKLIEELLYLVKEKSASGNKMEWKAPKSSKCTDDCVMSLALAVYSLKYLIGLLNQKRPIVKLGIRELDPFCNRFINVLGNRFTDDFIEEEDTESTFLDFF